MGGWIKENTPNVLEVNSQGMTTIRFAGLSRQNLNKLYEVFLNEKMIKSVEFGSDGEVVSVLVRGEKM